MVGRGVIEGEWGREKDGVLANEDKMEESNLDGFYPLYLSGVSIISTDGDGSMPEFGAFFKALHVQVFALYDAKKRKVEDEQKFKQNFNIPCQTAYSGTEKLLVEEIPVARLWEFLLDLHDSGEKPTLVLPAAMPAANEIKALAYSVLDTQKGSGYAGRLIDFCDFAELPATILGFLKSIYALFLKPAPIPPMEAPVVESVNPTPPAAAQSTPPGEGRM